uniref:SxtB protein n=1 Tax=Alexandrium pacificum TaxID=1565494 RepID=A0AA49X546_9DINO|nr:sxtB protein [Alexandrium pacificum]
MHRFCARTRFPLLCGHATRLVPRGFSAAAVSDDFVTAVVDRATRGILGKPEVEHLRLQTGLGDDAILQKLLPHAKDMALPQASGYQVGAAALGASGRIYLGFNLELSGLPPQLCVHAEQAAVYLAVDAGEEKVVTLATSATPCGHCRQFMLEMYGAPELRVVCPEQAPASLKELVPDPFGPHHLDVPAVLLQAHSHKLKLARQPQASDTLTTLALAAACRSYAPLGSPAGMALRMRDGTLSDGFAVWSVAFNPGLTTAGPLQGALVKLIAQGYRDFQEIEAAVLVEQEGEPVAFAEFWSAALQKIAPKAQLDVVYAQCNNDE